MRSSSAAAAPQFLDDQDYPYKVNRNSRLNLVLDNPRCFGVFAESALGAVSSTQRFLAQTRETPGSRLDRRPRLDRHSRRQPASAHWSKRGRVALGPDLPARSRRAESLSRSRCSTTTRPQTPYELECMRGPVISELAGIRPRRRASPRRLEYDAHMSYLEACRQREERCRTTASWLITRMRRCCIISIWNAPHLLSYVL